MRDGIAEDVTGELVDFLVHLAFYPVLMMQRRGPNKAVIEHVQEATYNEIQRFRGCTSAQEVVAVFEQDVRSGPAVSINSELRELRLPALADVRDEFEQKAHDLGVMTLNSRV